MKIGSMEPVYDPAAELGLPCYVNDHCIVRDRFGLYHLFHIKGFPFEGVHEGWNEMSELMFGHAVSADLRRWTTQPQCIPAHNDEKRVAAPCVVEQDGRYLMFYNSAGPQSIRRAASFDLYGWDRDIGPAFVPPSKDRGGWSNGQGRDAFVLRHRDSWLLYYTTMLWDGGGWLSAIGLAESPDLRDWRDVGPAFVARERGRVTWSKTESPCVFARDGRFHLLFTDRILDQVVTTSSDDPHAFGEKGIQSLGRFRASKVYCFDSKWYMTHCFLPLREGNRGLYLSELSFE